MQFYTKWLGGVILSGLLIAGSVAWSLGDGPRNVLAAAELQVKQRPVTIFGGGSVKSGTEVALAGTDEVRRQLKLVSYVIKSQPAENNRKPVEIASRSTPQVSRGSNDIDQLINRALSLQGIPYRWGGTDRDGFDCSGFVRYVFASAGVKLPRTSFEQYKLGDPVSRDQLRPGDLVFFSTYAKGASDVRIYIGGGRTIGASSDGVAIHSLSESYWDKHYIGARRIMP